MSELIREYYRNKHYYDVKSQDAYFDWTILSTCEFMYIYCHLLLAS
jgi:hypothetical protein